MLCRNCCNSKLIGTAYLNCQFVVITIYCFVIIICLTLLFIYVFPLWPGHIVTTDYKPAPGRLVRPAQRLVSALLHGDSRLPLGGSLPGCSTTWWCLTAYVACNQVYLLPTTPSCFTNSTCSRTHPAQRKIILPLRLLVGAAAAGVVLFVV